MDQGGIKSIGFCQVDVCNIEKVKRNHPFVKNKLGLIKWSSIIKDQYVLCSEDRIYNRVMCILTIILTNMSKKVLQIGQHIKKL
jgi:hypothetical protein